MDDEPRIDVVGLLGGRPVGPEAEAALAAATTVIGGADQLAAAAASYPASARTLELGAGLTALAAIEEGRVCVLASGDPGFFGIVRTLRSRFATERLHIHPGPSSVSLAFARVGLSWEDATVVSAHARALDTVVPVVRLSAKAAVLVSPENPPQALGAALLAAACGPRTVTVLSHLGEAGEEIVLTDLPGLAAGSFPSRSIVVLVDPTAKAGAARPTAWGRDTAAFAHRASMITKPEVRAAVLGRLDLPAAGVLWDLGAGSGSVAIEAALTAPGLRVIAVERRADDASRIRANAAALGAFIEVVEADAADVIASLPVPDRVFVGGGGLAVLDAALEALAPGGRLVATFAAVDRAAEAHRRLGDLVQISVDRADRLPDGGVRFVADNPVFLAWGPSGRSDPEPRGTTTNTGDRIVVGVGSSTTATADEVAGLVDTALADAGIDIASVTAIATVDRRLDHPAITALGHPVLGFAPAELRLVPVPTPSTVVEEAVGTPSVAEAAALLGAGPGAHLVLTKQANETATVAIASTGPAQPSPGPGSLAVVGLGPGDARHRTAAAVEAVRSATTVIGFGAYVDQCADLLRPDQHVIRSAMGAEAARATQAIEAAAAGERVALVSSGDPGVFAMASVTLELAAELAPDLDVVVIPGVTAAQSAAALVGAPLAHDHAAISLSDRLTSWEAIEARLTAAAASDLVLALYNPRSQGRTWQLDRARDLLLAHRAPGTPVALVTNASREGEHIATTTLGSLDTAAVGMNTIVLVGSSATEVLGGRIVTRRHHPRPDGTD